MRKLFILFVILFSYSFGQTDGVLKDGAGNVRLRVKGTTGRVGIATSSPSSRLHIATGDGGLTTTYAKIDSLSSSGTSIKFDKQFLFNASADYPLWILNQQTSSGSTAMYAQVFGANTKTIEAYNTTGITVYGSASTGYGGYFRSTSSSGIGLSAINTNSTGWAITARATDNGSNTFGVLGSGYVGVGASLASSDIDSLFTVNGSIHGKKHLKVDSTTYTGLLNVSGTSTLTGAVTATNGLTVGTATVKVLRTDIIYASDRIAGISAGDTAATYTEWTETSTQNKPKVKVNYLVRSDESTGNTRYIRAIGNIKTSSAAKIWTVIMLAGGTPVDSATGINTSYDALNLDFTLDYLLNDGSTLVQTYPTEVAIAIHAASPATVSMKNVTIYITAD